MERSKKSVAIIGAGAAGLSCAYSLYKEGYEFKIFEATARIGGRIYELNNFSKMPIELGAEIIHGKNSEFYKMAKEAGAQITKINDSIYVSYKSQFKSLESFYNKNTNKSFEFIWNVIDDIYAYNNEKYPDTNIKSFCLENNLTEEELFIPEALLGTEYSTDIDKLNINDLSNSLSNWCSGDEDYVIQDMSNMDIFRKLWAPVFEKIIVNKEIISVDYSSSKIILTDQNNENQMFDYCCVAVPLNLIQNMKFIPELPAKKASLLKQVEVDSLGKFLLKFSESFWPKNARYLVIPGLINIYWTCTKTSEPILTGFVGGSKCDEIEKLYKEDKEKTIKILLNEIEEALHIKVEHCYLDSFWFNWGTARFFQGGYSHPTKNLNNIKIEINEPIDLRIYFAGEGLAKKHNSTVHGAIESGKYAAKRIIKL